MATKRRARAEPQLKGGVMGYSARNNEIRDNVTRMKGEFENQRQSLQPAAASLAKFT